MHESRQPQSTAHFRFAMNIAHADFPASSIRRRREEEQSGRLALAARNGAESTIRAMSSCSNRRAPQKIGVVLRFLPTQIGFSITQFGRRR
jgi:hypothetical protein